MNDVEEQLAGLLRAAVPPVRAVPFERVAARRRLILARRAGLSAAAGAVSVAAAAALVVHGGTTGGPPSGLATGDGLSLAGTVPWTDAPAVPYTAPQPGAEPGMDARPCSAADVTAAMDGGNGAGGHSVVYVRFRNTSATPCVLKGYPQVTVADPGPPVTATDGSSFPSGSTANMPPGQSTLLGLESDTYCPAHPGGGRRTPYRHARISLPGGGAVTLAAPASGFDVACGIRLTAFFVPHSDPAASSDPLGELRAALETPAAVAPGSTLTYVVAMTNPTGQAVRLTPCPSYVESASGSVTAPLKAAHRLNCSAVPAIGVGATVRFQMRLQIPADASGTVTVTWALDGPFAVSASATIPARRAAQPARG